MTVSQYRLEKLVKCRFHAPRWIFLLPLVLFSTIAILWTDKIWSYFGLATLPLYVLAAGGPICLSYLQRVKSTSSNFVFYYTQRSPHEVGFHVRRKWFRRRPKSIDLESESSAEMCAGLRILRASAPSVMNIRSAHFSESENLRKLKQLVLQSFPAEVVELERKRLTYVSAFGTRIAMHGFRWRDPLCSLAFLHANARNTRTAGVRVTFLSPNSPLGKVPSTAGRTKSSP